MRVNPGELNKRISVYAFTGDAEDMAGGFSDSWETKQGWEFVCDTWASIRPASERAVNFANQLAVSITHTILIRYNPDIKVSDVVEHDGRRLDIQTIKDIDGKYMQLMCMEEIR